MSGTSKNIRWCNRIAARLRLLVSSARERLAIYLSVGRWGERAAHRFLSRHGVLPLQSNWRASTLEADLIAIDHRQAVVVEVKTRHHTLERRFPGVQSITQEKWRHLEKLGMRWMRNNGPLCRRFSLRSFRIDVVEVYYRPIFGPVRVVTDIRWYKKLDGP